MILSGREIKRQCEKGNIFISNFNEKQLNPNSYNLKLHYELMIYENEILDAKKENPSFTVTIPENGILLEANKLYLGRTKEFTRTDCFVPMIEGRSSGGRLGMLVHITAGFGDVSFSGYWTLEIMCIKPIIIYPNMEIAQIYYHTIQGDYDRYEGKYQDNSEIQGSMMYKEFEK
jgi:dCTP deaminase